MMPARPHENCYWVVPGKLMAGEYPGAAEPAKARAKLVSIATAGIQHFVDLTEAFELSAYQPLLARIEVELHTSLGYDRFAIPDLSVPQPASRANATLDRIDALLAAGTVPYVHCWGGIGRTGTIIGCWLVRHGASGPDALATLAERWQTVAKHVDYPNTPQTRGQREFILGWDKLDRLRTASAP